MLFSRCFYSIFSLGWLSTPLAAEGLKAPEEARQIVVAKDFLTAPSCEESVGRLLGWGYQGFEPLSTQGKKEFCAMMRVELKERLKKNALSKADFEEALDFYLGLVNRFKPLAHPDLNAACNLRRVDLLSENWRASLPLCEGEQSENFVQAGGHKASIIKRTHGGKSYVLKKFAFDPFKMRSKSLGELRFYCAAQKVGPSPLPQFHGVCRHPNGEAYLQMEDLLAPFKFPAVLDLKIGKKTFDRLTLASTGITDKSEISRKRRRMKLADLFGKSYFNGFRQAGSTDYSQSAFHKPDMKACFKEKLDRINDFVKKEGTNLRLVSSSLLFIYDRYDGDGVRCDVRMIDFANSFYLEKGFRPISNAKVQKAYLYGVRRFAEKHLR